MLYILGRKYQYFTVILLMTLGSTHILHLPPFLGEIKASVAQGIMLFLMNTFSNNSQIFLLISSFILEIIDIQLGQEAWIFILSKYGEYYLVKEVNQLATPLELYQNSLSTTFTSLMEVGSFQAPLLLLGITNNKLIPQVLIAKFLIAGSRKDNADISNASSSFHSSKSVLFPSY